MWEASVGYKEADGICGIVKVECFPQDTNEVIVERARAALHRFMNMEGKGETYWVMNRDRVRPILDPLK